MDLIKLNNVNKIYKLKKHFFSKEESLFAIRNFNLEVTEGQTLGIVGESGCGKSTLAKMLCGLTQPTSGNIALKNIDLTKLSRKQKLQVQFIFQDPHSSLNPRKKIWQIIAEPLFIHTSLSKNQCKEKVSQILLQVGLHPKMMDRYPHMFSGGQKQRVGIARALILKPKILICDEPVSALDVSVQAQILNLLNRLKKELNLTLIFISHDLSIVNYFCDKVIVMYLGEIVEQAKTKEIFQNPRHPYTRILLDSAPKIDDLDYEFLAIKGEIPSPLEKQIGCAFRSRCSFKSEECLKSPTVTQTKERSFSCFNPLK